MSTALLDHVSEAQLQTSVEVALTAHGWRWIHPKAQTGARGFPDIFAVRGSEALALELKSEDGRPSPDQLEWIAGLMATGIDAMIVRPSQTDWLDRRLSRTPIQQSFTSNSTSADWHPITNVEGN